MSLSAQAHDSPARWPFTLKSFLCKDSPVCSVRHTCKDLPWFASGKEAQCSSFPEEGLYVVLYQTAQLLLPKMNIGQIDWWTAVDLASGQPLGCGPLILSWIYSTPIRKRGPRPGCASMCFQSSSELVIFFISVGSHPWVKLHWPWIRWFCNKPRSSIRIIIWSEFHLEVSKTRVTHAYLYVHI